MTLTVKRKLSQLCAARSLAANRQREAISTDVRMREALSWGSSSSADKKELVPEQRHDIEAELAPKTVSWTGLMCFGPKKLFSFYDVKPLALILYRVAYGKSATQGQPRSQGSLLLVPTERRDG